VRYSVAPVGVDTTLYGDDAWLRDLAQQHAEDVVLAAALFKPNAAGRCELSWGGFGQRQLLKARGAYLAERLVVAVTPLDVVAVALSFRDRLQRKVRQWRRSDVMVVTVLAHGRALDLAWPAITISHRSGRQPAELQPVQRTPASERVTELLLAYAHLPAGSASA